MHTEPRTSRRSRGAVLVKVALLLPLLLAMVALAVDMGYIYLVRSELQSAADAAALAGASGLDQGAAEARRRAIEYAAKNLAAGSAVSLQDVDIDTGAWDPLTRTFAALDAAAPNSVRAVRVTARRNGERGCPVGLFFGGIVGVPSVDISTSAIAVYGARDIMLVIDYSASMNDDSELGHLSLLGRSEIEQNLYQIWQDLGAPVLGKMQFTPVYVGYDSTSYIRQALGLTYVNWPWPQGSWSEYFEYVQTSSTVYAAGYRRRYGYLTLMDYLLVKQFGAARTPQLAAAREQPLAAVKDAVTLFLGYIGVDKTGDRVGLAAYTSADGKGVLVEGLTDGLGLIEDASRSRQAGHYHEYTNIAGGIAAGRDELNGRARPGVDKMMVLLSDGKANWYNGGYSTSRARDAAIEQAYLAKQDKIEILTISLGAEADDALMQQIADITGGIHFRAPGGSDISDYETQLFEVFRRIAAYRPLKLVD